MTTTASPRRRGTPFNPALAEYQTRLKAEEDRKRRDRRSRDLLRNAMVVPVEMQDPLDPTETVIVMRSLRHDPVADMQARGQLSDCEFETARHWQRAYEDAEIGGVAAIDPGKECVDGGRLREVLTDRQIAAVKELKLARDELGTQGNYLIIKVLGTKMTLEGIAQEAHWGKAGEAQYKYVRRRFHECLRTLSVLFGYAMATRG